MTDSLGIIGLGVLGSLLAGLCTGAGAIGVFVVRGRSEKLDDLLLSFAAGVMLAATFFSLLLPAVAHAETQFTAKPVAVSVVIAGILMGAVVLHLIHRHVPHEHFLLGPEGPNTDKLARIWLFVIAITIHNFPEGMAVGVGFAGGDVRNGVALAIGIGIQNVPEGLAVALALFAVEYSRLKAFAVAFVTGLVEPVGGLFGSVAVWAAEPLMPVTLGFAAGAMLFIISDEIIPETHRSGLENLATFSLMGGFALMMFLDATLG